jgi:hypothetical protein
MFEIPQRKSPGCVLLMVELALIVFGLFMAGVGLQDIFQEGPSFGLLVLTVVALAFALFGIVCAKETLTRDTKVVVELSSWEAHASELVPRELEMLDRAEREIAAAPSIENALKVLNDFKTNSPAMANKMLQPISFSLRATNAGDISKGVILGFFSAIGAVVTIPLAFFVGGWQVGKHAASEWMKAFRYAQRYQIQADRVLRTDPRPPILYLRGFNEEFNHSLESFFPTTAEEKLANYYNDFGPTIAVGNPDEELPLLGASRIYFSESNWHEGVLYLMSVSRMVIIQASIAPGVLWELGVAKKTLSPEQLVISFAGWADCPPRVRETQYLQFKRYFERLSDWKLPEKIGNQQVVVFGPGWVPSAP